MSESHIVKITLIDHNPPDGKIDIEVDIDPPLDTDCPPSPAIIAMTQILAQSLRCDLDTIVAMIETTFAPDNAAATKPKEP